MIILTALGKNLVIRMAQYDSGLLSLIRAYGDVKWNQSERHWTTPLSNQAVNYFADVFQDVAVDIDPVVRKMINLPVKQEAEVPANFFHRIPRAHQLEAFKLAMTRDSFALFMEMRTGKTKVALDLFNYWREKGLVERLLIVCPFTIFDVWIKEAEKDIPKIVAPVLAVGVKHKRVSIIEQNPIVVINYETVRTCRETLLQLMLRKKYMIVADESTKIKNPSAEQTKALLAIGVHAKKKLILTGTPQTQNYLDLYSQMRFLSPSIIGFSSFWKYKNWIAILGGYGGYEIKEWKAEAVAIVKKAIEKNSYRCLASDCLDLPPKQYQVIPVTMDKEQANYYKTMQKDLLIETDDSSCEAAIILTKILRLQEITAGFLRLENDKILEIESAKYNAAIEYINQCVNDGHKVVVQCKYLPEIDRLSRGLAALGLYCSVVSGAYSPEERAEQIRLFHLTEGPMKNDVFIGQVATAGMGIDLSCASILVRYTPTYSLADTAQFEARLDRAGQTKSVLIVDIVTQGTIDYDINMALQKKYNLSQVLMRQGRMLFLGKEWHYTEYCKALSNNPENKGESYGND